MPDNIGSAWVEINSNIAQLQREIAGLRGHVDASARNMETRFNSATKAIAGLAGVIGTIGIVKLGRDILAASTKMDTLNRMLVNIEGSQTKANKRFEEFRILAKEPVLDPFNLSRFYVGLKSVNVEADLSIRFMKSLANAMAGVGASNEQFASSMEQVVQMMGKGKLVGQDLRVIAESFPQIRKYLAEAFGGIVDPEELAKKGYTALDVLTKLNEAMEKSPHFAGGAQAAQDNFRQSLVLFEGALGKDLLPTFSKFLDKLTELMDKFSQLDAPIKKFIGTAVVGGMGLLGIASAVGAITTALNLLSVSSGLKALTSVGAGVAAGRVSGAAGKHMMEMTAAEYAASVSAKYGIGAPATGFMAGAGLNLPTIAAATIMVGTAVFAGKEIWKAFTRDFTKEEKAEIASAGIKNVQKTKAKLQEVQFGAGNFPAMTFQEMVGAGATTKDNLEIWFEALGQSFEYWQDKTFAELERSLAMPGKMYKTEAGPPEPIVKISPLAISYADMIKEIGEASVDFLMNPYGYSTEAGKYKSKLIPHAGAEELGMLKARQTVEMGIRTPELFPIEQVTGPQVGTTGIVGPSMRGGTIIDKDFLRETNIEWAKTYETKKKIIDITEKTFQTEMDNVFHLTEAEDDAQNKRIANYDYIMGKIKKVNKEQSQFWLDMKFYAGSTMDMITDKSITSVFDKLFSTSNMKEAYKDYLTQLHLARVETERQGKTFQEIQLTYKEFSHDYRTQNKLNSQSWKEFCQEMLSDFTKMLITMAVEAEAKNVFNLVTRNKEGYGGISGMIANMGKNPETIPGGVGGTIGGKIGKVAGFATPATAVAVGSYELGTQAGKYAPTTSKQRGWFGKFLNVMNPFLAWGIREGSKEWRESQGLEHYASGGIVTKPTIAMIGESGPEAIVPLSKGNITNKSDNFIVNISFPNATLDSVDQNQIDRFISKAIPSLRRAVSNGELS